MEPRDPDRGRHHVDHIDIEFPTLGSPTDYFQHTKPAPIVNVEILEAVARCEQGKLLTSGMCTISTAPKSQQDERRREATSGIQSIEEQGYTQVESTPKASRVKNSTEQGRAAKIMSMFISCIFEAALSTRDILLKAFFLFVFPCL